ncbi:MAG: MBL fold metallo-hydrolase [Planctomycetota bacterium]|jgi:glyoxylase-like metal-dependent hydrolase (beta-lactamase superfamily II)
MKIDHLILGAYETNCYILRKSENARDCVVIDTGLESDKLIDFLGEHKLNPLAVVLTHGHVDHIAGVAVLLKNYPDVKVYMHKIDAEMLRESANNVSARIGRQPSTLDIVGTDFLIEGASIIKQAGIKLQVLHTPGHTPGGICLYSKGEGIVFTDDTLFADGVGRTDLGGNMEQLIKSIKEKLFTLPDETAVYPGHGPVTTIAQEKKSNPHLQ